MRQALAKPEIKERVAKLGGIAAADTPAEFRAFLEKDMERWTRVVKASGVKAE
jgi:tripartite-type tricarboxylate transporter receptor subunit TctC